MRPNDHSSTLETPPRIPITARLIGEWKRSLSARARILILAGPVSNQDLADMAHTWVHLDSVERMIRLERHLPDPGETPQWVADHA